MRLFSFLQEGDETIISSHQLAVHSRQVILRVSDTKNSYMDDIEVKQNPDATKSIIHVCFVYLIIILTCIARTVILV